MIMLYDAETGVTAGTLTESQLQFLVDQLEKESLEDRDYYINKATLKMFQKQGADSDLLAKLRHLIGNRDEMEIRWTRA
ncbi:MAG: galactosyldiacylglycerol synthase [Chloroflexota bacterium]